MNAHATLPARREARVQEYADPAHNRGMKHISGVVEHHVPGFVRVERDLLAYAVGTVVRYHGGHDATVVVLRRGFEVTSAETLTQTWAWSDTASRLDAAAQAAQFVTNRLALQHL